MKVRFLRDDVCKAIHASRIDLIGPGHTLLFRQGQECEVVGLAPEHYHIRVDGITYKVYSIHVDLIGPGDKDGQHQRTPSQQVFWDPDRFVGYSDEQIRLIKVGWEAALGSAHAIERVTGTSIAAPVPKPQESTSPALGDIAKALEPFAGCGDLSTSWYPDNHEVFSTSGRGRITAGDLRRAAALFYLVNDAKRAE